MGPKEGLPGVGGTGAWCIKYEHHNTKTLARKLNLFDIVRPLFAAEGPVCVGNEAVG